MWSLERPWNTKKGKYDFEFMDYTVRILRKYAEYGSKSSSTLLESASHRSCETPVLSQMFDSEIELSKMDIYKGRIFKRTLLDPNSLGYKRHMTATQFIIVHSKYPAAQSPDPPSLPTMLWSTDYGRLAAQTLFHVILTW
ncbi:hypothetical protein BU17DRAFT_71559 [Hysterangium stoloniferum]|nr:hypothetical protein BU17DRAFT_71559 [Hysterangium stoloniferum]